MKFHTTHKYLFLADYYSYKVVTSSTGSVSTKVYETNPQQILISMTSDLALGGAATVTGTDLGSVFARSATKLQIDGLVKNIKDARGAVMYEGGGEWIVTMSAPFIGPNGQIEGYKYRMAQTAGNK